MIVYLKLEDCLKSCHLRNREDSELFIENCTKWECINEGKVNLLGIEIFIHSLANTQILSS